MATPILVAAVDDHPVMLLGLRAALAAHADDLLLVGTATAVGALLSGITTAHVVLLDLGLPDGSRPRDDVRRLLQHGARVLVHTDGARPAAIADAVRAGATGVVLKDQEPEVLVRAVRTVAQGGTWLSPELSATLDVARPRLAPREVEVLQLVSDGLASKQVASRLGIKEETVKEYLKRIRAKYEAIGRPAGTRVHLQLRAREDGYLDGPGPA